MAALVQQPSGCTWALGPKRAVMQPNGLLPRAISHGDNPTACSTRAMWVCGCHDNRLQPRCQRGTGKKFLGVKGDIEVQRIIRLYLTPLRALELTAILVRRELWNNPRSRLAGHLADQGISFTHTLLSTRSAFKPGRQQSNDQPYILLIPTFTMIAAITRNYPPI